MKYDVIVVGAGPAGATAAAVLAEQGLSVLLLDKAAFPRDKPCGGGLPTRVIQQFPHIQKYIDSYCYGSTTYSSSFTYTFSIIREKPLLFMVNRSVFDVGLIQFAQKKGAVFLPEKKVVDIKIFSDKALVVSENQETFEASVVVGCDGVHSIVAKKTMLQEKNEPRCISIFSEQQMDQKQLNQFFSKKRIVHIFIKIQGIAGYGWIFPKKKSINIGIGEFTSSVDQEHIKKNLKLVFEEFIQTCKQKNILPQDFLINNMKGGILPVFPLKKTYADRVLVCGDAAGFINSITGEGIYYAMKSGVLAAEVIKKAFSSNDFSEQILKLYQKRWYTTFGKDLALFARFHYQWGKKSDHFVRLLTGDAALAKLVIGAVGGQISFSKYKYIIFVRYLYARLKNHFFQIKKKEK